MIAIEGIGRDTIRDVITADGENALQINTTGNLNTAVGQNALFQNTTGSGDIALGVQAGANVTTADQVICIGAGGENVSNSCYIGNIFSATSGSGTAVFVNSAGKLGTSTSSRRFKQQIKPMEQASEALLFVRGARNRAHAAGSYHQFCADRREGGAERCHSIHHSDGVADAGAFSIFR